MILDVAPDDDGIRHGLAFFFFVKHVPNGTMALPQPPLWTVTVDALCMAWRLVVCGPEHNH